MTAHLVSRPIPIPGESPASILMRAVEGNGCPSLQALIWSFWGNKSGNKWATAAHVDPARYGEILSAFGVEVREVESICFRRAGPTSESPRVMDGMKVPEAMFREDGRYYCPMCLAKRPFWRRNWSLRGYSVCTEHHVYLLRDCPECNLELKPWRGKLATCDCGGSLPEMASSPADPSAVIWWLELHKTSVEGALEADALFLALSEADGGADDPQAEHRRLCAVRDWFEKGEVSSSILEWVQRKAEELHPRLLLLPLLRRVGHAKIDGLVQAILGQWVFQDSMPSFSGAASITRREAELAMGISSAQFRKFLKTSLLNFPDGEKPQRGQVSLAAVNNLLFILHAAGRDVGDSVGRAQTCSVASMAESVLSGEHESAGYDVTEGLNTLRLKQQKQGKQSEVAAEWMDTNQVAEMMGTYPEAVRFLRIKGWVSFRDRDLQGKKRYIANRQDVNQFHQTYVLGGEIAAQLGMNPTNLSEKLMALGVKPVAGPKIDGLLVYLFRRSEVEQINLEELRQMETYPTAAGRKQNTVECGSVKLPIVEMTAVVAAEELDIRPCDVHTLIRKGFLERVSKQEREIFVSAKSVQNLRRKLHHKDYISIEDAAQRLSLSSATLESRWIKRGALKVHDLGLWRRIDANDLEALRTKLDGKVTAEEAGRMLSMHRSHLPNIERRGIIKSEKLGGKLGVRLYKIEDIKNFVER